MLELIFQGFAEWAYGLVLECWQYFSTALLDIMSLDFAYMKTHIPVVNDMMQVLLAVGWALLIGNLVFQAMKSMVSGLGFEGEDPKLLFARTFVFAFLLMASPQICEIGLDMTSDIMAVLQMPNAVNVGLVDDSAFGALTASWLLVIICGLIVMFKVLGLLVEIAERYVILAVLTMTAPLAFAMGGSRSTSEIFTGWCRMYGSMCVLMALNVVFFKMLLSVLSSIPSGLDVLLWMVLIFAIVKVAKKADAIVTRIGLNPAITGDDLGVRLPGALTYMVVRSMTASVAKAAGKSAGSTGRGRSPSTPPGGSGGGPRGGAPFGGRNSAGPGAAGFTQQSTAQQNTQQQGGSQQSSTAQAASQQSTQQTTAKEQSAGTTVSASSQVRFGGAGQQSRKSAVPPGARRSPSHVKSAGAPTGGANPTGGRSGASVHQSAAQTTAQQEYGSHTHDASGGPTAAQLGTAGTSSVAGAPTRPGAVRPGMAGTPSHTTGSERTGASKPGTAGMGGGSTTRFTQASAQTVQGGAVSGHVQASEQNNISVGQQHRLSGAEQTGHRATVSGHTMPQAPGGSSAQGTRSEPGPTRYTQREKPTVQGMTTPATPVAAQTPPATAHGAQSGAAGTGAVRSSERPAREPRHGRNGSPTAPTPPVGSAGASSAAQEVYQTPKSTMPTVSSGAPKPQPGRAGTAATEHRASQARQSTARQTTRARFTPTATDSLGGKRAASTASGIQKGRVTGTGGGSAPKPETRLPRQKRGPEHGK